MKCKTGKGFWSHSSLDLYVACCWRDKYGDGIMLLGFTFLWCVFGWFIFR